MSNHFLIICEQSSHMQACQINLSVKFGRNSRKSVKADMESYIPLETAAAFFLANLY